MRRVKRLYFALTGNCKMTLSPPSWRTLAVAMPKNVVFGWLRRAAAVILTAHFWKMPLGLVFLLLLGGCALSAPRVPPAPVVVGTIECPAPESPVLPELDAALSLDAPGNVRALLERDDLCRHYIEGLRAAIRCYASRIKGDE